MILFIPLINSSVSTWDYDLIKLSDGMALRAVCNFQETFFGYTAVTFCSGSKPQH